MHIENASLSVDQCLFDGNYSQNEIGALQVRADSLIWFSLYDLNISNTIFRNNISSGLVAGAQIEQTDTTQSLMNVRLDHCTFTANNAYRVPGLRIIGKIKDFTVSNCLFSENTVTTQNAAAHFLSKCTGRVENCLFIKNSGGANITINIEAEVEFINCTIADNNSDEVAGLSLRRGGKAVLTNTIIRNNCRNEIRLTTAVGLGNEITINHCNIRNGIDSVLVSDSLCLVNWGSGNIDADPLFIDTTVNDYHLQDTSPCIGAGINCLKIDEIWHCAPPYDLDGISRPSPEGTNTDMGAYEHPLGLPSAIAVNENQMPERSALFQNYPNPFNPSTVITWQVAVGSNVALSIYNVLGEKVTTLVSRRMNAGTYSCTFDGNNLASGVYYYRLDTASFHAVQKMILLR
jgi:hypothetical protein